MEEPGDDESNQKNSICKSAAEYAKRRARGICTKKTLYKRLPILRWLPRYNGQDALGDLVAGITVGLTVIPQSLAYSNVAGLPPQVLLNIQIFSIIKYIYIYIYDTFLKEKKNWLNKKKIPFDCDYFFLIWQSYY